MADGKKWSASGRLSQALQSFETASALARQSGDTNGQARGLMAVSAMAIRLRRYSCALDTAQRSKTLALTVKDLAIAGGASVNLSAVFNQLGEFERARQEAAEAVGYLKGTSNRRFHARALLSLALLDYRQKDNRAGETTFDEAIRAAQAAADPELEAVAWDERGILLLDENIEVPNQHLLGNAEESLTKAYQIRQARKDDYGIALSEEHLAELQLQKPGGDYRLALTLVNRSLASSVSRVNEGLPYYPIHIKAKILQKLGDPGALAEFRRAVQVASDWRRTALPGDITNTQTVAQMHDVYTDFASAAADASLRQNNPALAREALEVLAENRAANLRELLAASLGRRMQLPQEYFDTVSQLARVQEGATFQKNNSANIAELQQILRNLQDIEIKIGIADRNEGYAIERKSFKNSLKTIQGSLGPRQVLLSFCLGDFQSFLWTLTREQISLYRLPKVGTIEDEAKLFTRQVRSGLPSSASGQQLSSALFGQLPQKIWERPEWLVVGDGGLLDRVPFPALPKPDQNPAFISSSRSLRFLPSELLLLNAAKQAPTPRFVGIGDPIYNLADSRRPASLLATAASQNRTALSLARLAGSRREISSSAAVSGLPSDLLTGADATAKRLESALDLHPEIVHIAAHIVSPDGQPQHAAIALSLTRDGVPELLTPEAIAALRVPGSLVVLSGCSSEQGALVPSEGMTGLSRAWLLAGAAAVIVSAWPTPDDSGTFFASFYRHLQNQTPGTLARRAAFALEQTQLEMQSDRSYRSAPSFWAAYSIISKE